jgi:16S rRNA (uracil1498-N3)-methyltransferase
MKDPPWILVAPGLLEVGQEIRLDPTEARHVTGPLRRRHGDRVVLIDGEGGLAEAELQTARGRDVHAAVLSSRFEAPPEDAGISLALGVLGNQAMDWAVQKAVELGVRCLHPLIAERTQTPHRTIFRRVPHWRRVARQSLKQCKRVWAMEVSEPSAFDDIVEQCPPENGAVAHREGVPIHQVEGTMVELLLVGPEGGFTPGEIGSLQDRNWPLLRLGSHVLRAETAAVAGAALLIACRGGEVDQDH